MFKLLLELEENELPVNELEASEEPVALLSSDTVLFVI